MATFEEQMFDWVRKTKAKLRLANREIILAVAVSVVDKTPVGQPDLWAHKPPPGYLPGGLKANWVGSFGSIDYSTNEFVDPSGEVSLVQIANAIPDDPTGIFYITNSMPYAQWIEDGNAIHNIPPGGMVALTVVEYEYIAAASIVKVSDLNPVA